MLNNTVGEVKRHRPNNFMNDSFNSPNHNTHQKRDLSLNNDILNDSMRSEAKPHAPAMNGYNVDNSTQNKRPSVSIQSTPKGETGKRTSTYLTIIRGWKGPSDTFE